MIIGSSHGVGGGPTQTEVLSTVVAQLEPIHATCMEEVNKNIDQIIQYMEIGARGLRAVLEEVMTKVMYEVPSDPTITRVTITPEAVLKTGEPEITRDPQRTERPGRTRDGKAEHDPSAPAS